MFKCIKKTLHSKNLLGEVTGRKVPWADELQPGLDEEETLLGFANNKSGHTSAHFRVIRAAAVGVKFMLQIMSKGKGMGFKKWLHRVRTFGTVVRKHPLPSRTSSARTKAESDFADFQLEEAQELEQKQSRTRQLISVVREVMNHWGILSKSYKFKTLALDEQGLQFILLVEVESGLDKNPLLFPSIEAQLGRAIESRHCIVLKAVFWRVNQSEIAAESPHNANAASRKHHPYTRARETGLGEVEAAAAKAPETQRLSSMAASKKEIAEFEAAMALAMTPGSLRNPATLTNSSFVDTENQAYPSQALSGTQYAELR